MIIRFDASFDKGGGLTAEFFHSDMRVLELLKKQAEACQINAPLLPFTNPNKEYTLFFQKTSLEQYNQFLEKMTTEVPDFEFPTFEAFQLKASEKGPKQSAKVEKKQSAHYNSEVRLFRSANGDKNKVDYHVFYEDDAHLCLTIKSININVLSVWAKHFDLEYDAERLELIISGLDKGTYNKHAESIKKDIELPIGFRKMVPTFNALREMVNEASLYEHDADETTVKKATGKK